MARPCRAEPWHQDWWRWTTASAMMAPFGAKTSCCLIRPVDAFALTYVEVMCLSREGFLARTDRSVEGWRASGSDHQWLLHRGVRVAASRGVLAEARRRTRITRLTKLRSSAAAAKGTGSVAVPPPPVEPVVPLVAEKHGPPEEADFEKVGGGSIFVYIFEGKAWKDKMFVDFVDSPRVFVGL
eukprot:Skav209160  [mRNA]  locus=scaffold1137:211053:213937:- [translate_table: standard]